MGTIGRFWGRVGVCVALGLCLVALSGCDEGERRRVSRESNALTAVFEQQMLDGKTTREEEQAFIRAVSKVAFQMDASIRGTKKATATREAAKEIAAHGGNPLQPLNLDNDSDE